MSGAARISETKSGATPDDSENELEEFVTTPQVTNGKTLVKTKERSVRQVKSRRKT